MTDIILASASPRRLEIFKDHALDPKVIVPVCDEIIPFDMTPPQTVMYLALLKALNVHQKIHQNDFDAISLDDMIVAADTIVFHDGKILGKPNDEDDAYDMLKSMSGQMHKVLTGVVVISDCPRPIRCFYESTDVYFNDIPDEELRSYVKTAEPYDKAGAYAIQGTFSRYTHHLDGDLENVIGFPFTRFERLVSELICSP